MVRLLVDFDGVSTEGSVQTLPIGIYEFSVDASEAELKPSSAGNDQLIVRFVVESGDYKGMSIRESFTQVKQALWKMANFLVAIKLLAPGTKGKIDIDTKQWHGKRFYGRVSHDNYMGEPRAKISAFFPLDKKPS